jgi:hypothetical protein
MGWRGWKSMLIVRSLTCYKGTLLIGAVLKDELETTMRMMGITDVSQVHPGLLNTRAVDHLIPDGEEHPYAKWRPKARI